MLKSQLVLARVLTIRSSQAKSSCDDISDLSAAKMIDEYIPFQPFLDALIVLNKALIDELCQDPLSNMLHIYPLFRLW
jgi:hypothetical protein